MKNTEYPAWLSQYKIFFKFMQDLNKVENRIFGIYKHKPLSGKIKNRTQKWFAN